MFLRLFDDKCFYVFIGAGLFHRDAKTIAQGIDLVA